MHEHLVLGGLHHGVVVVLGTISVVTVVGALVVVGASVGVDVSALMVVSFSAKD